MKEFIITKQNEGQRFDKYLARIIGNGGMSFIFKMLRKKNFVLNDKKATGKEILRDGDVIKLYLSDDTFEKFKTINDKVSVIADTSSKFDFSKKIIYEDKDIILFNKPVGILSQKANSDDISINEYVIDYLLKKNEIDDNSLLEYKPSCINRLDRNTSGIIIIAKTLKAARVISQGLKDRTINKYYKCIVNGNFNKNGLFKGYLLKDNQNNKVTISDVKESDDSSYIETEYCLIEQEKNNSIVEVHLLTGKSHQIRAHLSYLGFPIIGDRKYGKKDINDKYKAKNQLLHAYKIVFPKYDDCYEFDFSGKTFISEPEFRY